MTWASRDLNDLTDKAMQKITKEINTASRDLVWLIFTVQDLSLDPQPAYFPANDIRARGRDEPSKLMRVNLPVPKNVNAEHIHHLVYSIIRDGYDFYGYVFYPGREQAA
jgi:chorismate mutase